MTRQQLRDQYKQNTDHSPFDSLLGYSWWLEDQIIKDSYQRGQDEPDRGDTEGKNYEQYKSKP